MSVTLADIQRIEEALSVKLPKEYQELLIDYPFSEDSFGTSCMVVRDADALIELNQTRDTHFMLHHREGRWLPQKNHFFIGNDGGEEQYYLDLDDPAATVFRFELETGKLTPYAKGIAEYKVKIHQIDREIEEDEKRAEERRRSAKWWEFWKKL